MTKESQPKGISRRTVAKGAAWAIPAVPLIVATPAYAASPGCVTLDLARSCKWPGQSTGDPWAYDLVLCNNCGLPIEITRVEKREGSEQVFYTDLGKTTIFDPWDYPTTPDPFIQGNTLAPGACWELPRLYSSDSGNFLEVDYNYIGGETQTIDKVNSPPDCSKS